MDNKRNTKFKEETRFILCLNCKKKGHNANKCPYSRCYWCYGKGHITKNCPYGPSRSCNSCNKIANINYHEQEKYYCQFCFQRKTKNNENKYQENKNIIKGTKA